MTPFHKAHSTEVAGLHDNPCGDDRFYNNLFVGRGDLSPYDAARLPVWMDGNVFLKGAKPSKHEKDPLVKPEFDPALKLVEKADGFYLEITVRQSLGRRADAQTRDHRTARQGHHPESSLRTTGWHADPRQHRLFRQARNEANPTPGPFENPGAGRVVLKVW